MAKPHVEIQGFKISIKKNNTHTINKYRLTIIRKAPICCNRVPFVNHYSILKIDVNQELKIEKWYISTLDSHK